MNPSPYIPGKYSTLFPTRLHPRLLSGGGDVEAWNEDFFLQNCLVPFIQLVSAESGKEKQRFDCPHLLEEPGILKFRDNLLYLFVGSKVEDNFYSYLENTEILCFCPRSGPKPVTKISSFPYMERNCWDRKDEIFVRTSSRYGLLIQERMNEKYSAASKMGINWIFCENSNRIVYEEQKYDHDIGKNYWMIKVKSSDGATLTKFERGSKGSDVGRFSETQFWVASDSTIDVFETETLKFVERKECSWSINECPWTRLSSGHFISSLDDKLEIWKEQN